MSAARLTILFEQHATSVLTPQEKEELFLLLGNPDYADTVQQLLDQRWEDFMVVASPFTQAELDQMLQRVTSQVTPIRKVDRMHILRTTWFRVAAAVILFLGAGGYFLLSDRTPRPVLITTTAPGTQQDILPGTNRATLVLGDESIIELDTAANGLLTMQGESEVIKTDNGEILYSNGSVDHANVFYQKLITPRGGQYQITLSDGTQVWLNAESSIRFPNIFKEDTRTVEITGEVYFDVKADKSKPFIVKTPRELITVLGTSFNVNRYTDEPEGKISLINGAVKVGEKILQPGQAFVNGKIITTNTEQDVAWKDGYFNFQDVTLEQAMKQIGRWYDVEVKYSKQIPNMEFGGKMRRNLSLSQVLEGLNIMGVSFTLQGRTIIVGS